MNGGDGCWVLKEDSLQNRIGGFVGIIDGMCASQSGLGAARAHLLIWLYEVRIPVNK